MSPPPEETPADWRHNILEYIAGHADRPLKARGLARALEIDGPDYPAFRALVRELLADGTLVYGRARTLRLPSGDDEQPANTFTGIFRAHRRGFGFVECPPHEDLYVPRGRTADALDGDVVEARHIPGRRKGEDPRAEVLRIISHGQSRWVGPLEQREGLWCVDPIGKTPAPLIIIEDPTAKSARPGDLVVVEPLDAKLNPRAVRGVIVERLGEPSSAEVKVRAIAARYGLAEKFEPDVLAYARAAVADFDPTPRERRDDLRDLLTITIDPFDARDFDDAITLERNGREVTLGVHIADVATFVQPDSALDREARARGNSTYFPGYVVPMLPEILSNGICSLQPGQPRLTKSVFIDYDQRGKVLGARFCNGLIQSDCRLTYEQATALLDGESVDDVSDEVAQLVREAGQLAKTIQKRRRKAGMIALALPEVELKLDNQGEVSGAEPADTSFSHTLIEMFMVEANEAVCRLFAELDLPHLRRTHPEPEPEAAERLAQQLGPLGIAAPEDLSQRAIQLLLSSVEDSPVQQAVNYLLLRSLAQATYSPGPTGHFALASNHYCHFTSPIRRYPDLVVHRLLAALLDYGIKRRPDEDDLGAPSEELLQEIGRSCSASERMSQQAERDAIQWLLLAFLEHRVGDTFEGVITGVTKLGAFVQIQPYLAEGLVHADDFGPDHWEYFDESSMFVGRHSRRAVTFGQRVRVQIASIDSLAGEMNLVPESPEAFGVPARKLPGRAGKGRPGRKPPTRKPGGRGPRGRRGRRS